MLPNLKEPIGLYEFVHGEKDRRADIVKFVGAWDKIDRALAANKNKSGR